MNKKILISLAILVFLSLGTNLLASHYTFEGNMDWEVGGELGLIGIYDGNDSEALILTLTGLDLTLVGKWEPELGTTNGGWTLMENDSLMEIVLQWNGPGIVTHIVVKGGNGFALYLLLNPLEAEDTQQIITELINNGGQIAAISHVSGYEGVSVPEPATLVLLGLGLLAVPVTRKFTG